MLGRKTYTQEELDNGKARFAEQLAAYDALAASGASLDEFEPLFFNNLALALDRLYVHRLRGVTGKDGNPLNELELITESLMNNGGILRGINVVTYIPEESVVGLEIGDEIHLSADDFRRLADGVFATLEIKYVNAGVA